MTQVETKPPQRTTQSIHVDAEFIDFYRRVQPFTMVDLQRMFALYDAVRYVVRAGVPGDLVECGVYRGGCCMLMALTLDSLGDTERRIYLYDTFAGMSEPGVRDVSADGRKIATTIWSAQRAEGHNRWCYAGLEDVRANLASTGFDPARLVFVEGRTQETIPGTAPERIALLRLDTDWYDSTRHEMTHLYPRLSMNGVLASDDYGHWNGHREAIDEVLREHADPMLLNRVSCGAVGIRTVGGGGAERSRGG